MQIYNLYSSTSKVHQILQSIQVRLHVEEYCFYIYGICALLFHKQLTFTSESLYHDAAPNETLFHQMPNLAFPHGRLLNWNI